MKPKIQSSDGGVEGHAEGQSTAPYDETITALSAPANNGDIGGVNAGPARNFAAGVEPGPSETPSSVSTPAQDATALADELAQISGRCSYERDRETIIKAVAALRATSQTPDAVREVETTAIRVAVLFAARELIEANRKSARPEDSQPAIDKLRAALRSTPSASAGPQAEAYHDILRALSDSQSMLVALTLKHSDEKALSDLISDNSKLLAASTHVRLMDYSSIVETCAKVCDAWVADFHGLSVRHVDAPSYAVDCVRDVAEAIRALYAHPQPQQADGREAVIEAQLRAIRKKLVETYNEATPSGYSIATSKVKQWIFAIDAALQQSDGSPK